MHVLCSVALCIVLYCIYLTIYSITFPAIYRRSGLQLQKTATPDPVTDTDLSTPNPSRHTAPPLSTDLDRIHSSDINSDNSTTTNTTHTKSNNSPYNNYTYDTYDTTTTTPIPEHHHTLETLRNSTPLYPLTLHLHDTPVSTGHNSDPHSDNESHTDADDIEPYITSTHTTDTPTTTATATTNTSNTTNKNNCNSHIYTWIQRMTSHLHISTPTHSQGQGGTKRVTNKARHTYGSSSGTAGTDDSGLDNSSSNSNADGDGGGGGDGCISKVELYSSPSTLGALFTPLYGDTHVAHTTTDKATTTGHHSNSNIYTCNAFSSTPTTSAADTSTTDLTVPNPTLTAEQYIYYGEVRSLHIPYLYLIFSQCAILYILHVHYTYYTYPAYTIL